MNKKRLEQRQKYIAATPVPNRIVDGASRRREENFVKKEIHDNDKFDNFFDYEEDLAELKPSNELYNSSEQEVIEEINTNKDANVSKNSGIILKRKNEDNANNLSNSDKPKYMQVSGFEFKQCTFIKANKDRCGRQAPKDNDKCSKHR